MDQDGSGNKMNKGHEGHLTWIILNHSLIWAHIGPKLSNDVMLGLF